MSDKEHVELLLSDGSLSECYVAHVKRCSRRETCAACHAIRKHAKWQRQLSAIPWLALCQHRDGSIGVGCALCAHSGARTGFASFEATATDMQLSHLLRHEASPSHCKAVSAAGFPTNGPQIMDAPSEEIFREALKKRLEGVACQAGLKDLGIGPDKLRKLSFCLAEAKRMLLRAWLKDEAVSISLQQDERHQRLLVRFTAASATLQRRSGVLGLAKNFGSCAGAVSAATEKVIRQFCTLCCEAPGLNRSGLAADEGLLESLRTKIEVIVADNASDEQKASALLRKDFCPNIRLTLRDCAHASRRTGLSGLECF